MGTKQKEPGEMTVNNRIKNGDQPHLRLGSYNLMSGQYLNCISYQPPENGLGEGLALPIQGFRGVPKKRSWPAPREGTGYGLEGKKRAQRSYKQSEYCTGYD